MRQHLPSAGKAETMAYPIDLENDLLDGNFWFLFPNTTIGQLPGTPSLFVSSIVPTGPETAIRRGYSIVSPDFNEERDRARREFSMKYVVAEDEGLYRRSLYTFWRRTVPPPSMMGNRPARITAAVMALGRTRITAPSITAARN